MSAGTAGLKRTSDTRPFPVNRQLGSDPWIDSGQWSSSFRRVRSVPLAVEPRNGRTSTSARGSTHIVAGAPLELLRTWSLKVSVTFSSGSRLHDPDPFQASKYFGSRSLTLRHPILTVSPRDIHLCNLAVQFGLRI